MAKHEVLSPVEHDGVRYEEGAMVALPAEVAEVLAAAGVLRLSEAAGNEGRKPRAGED